MFRLAFGVAHEAAVKGLLGSDVVVVVECQLAALTALEIFRHRFPLMGSRLTCVIEYSPTPVRSMTRDRSGVENLEILLHGLRDCTSGQHTDEKYASG